MLTPCLNEIRLLGSDQFDSKSLLTSVLCGDMRLPERFRNTALVSLGTRMRIRMTLQPYSHDDLVKYLNHAISQAGASHLMTQTLMQTLAHHAAGNLRVLNTMAAELLSEGARKEIAQLDEKLFLQLFSRKPASP
jgi:type II secretory pathway predicted ATPase ExeA